MSFTQSWNEAYPAGTTAANELDTAITLFKYATRERLAVDHDFRDDETGSEDTITPTGTIGYHKKVTLTERSADPSNVSNAGILYTKDDSGDTELYFEDDSANIIQVTKDGALNVDTDAILGLIYPVGIVVTLGVSTNPATLFGIGTWTAIAGKVIVGINAGDAEFDTLDETGGEKTHTLTAAESGLPAHSHTAEGYAGMGAVTSHFSNNTTEASPSSTLTTDACSAAAASSAHNNLQPYIVKYVWQRTA